MTVKGIQFLLAKGEDPFRDMENPDELYNVDKERLTGVLGPESYTQFRPVICMQSDSSWQ